MGYRYITWLSTLYSVVESTPVILFQLSLALVSRYSRDSLLSGLGVALYIGNMNSIKRLSGNKRSTEFSSCLARLWPVRPIKNDDHLGKNPWQDSAGKSSSRTNKATHLKLRAPFLEICEKRNKITNENHRGLNDSIPALYRIQISVCQCGTDSFVIIKNAQQVSLPKYAWDIQLVWLFSRTNSLDDSSSNCCRPFCPFSVTHAHWGNCTFKVTTYT